MLKNGDFLKTAKKCCRYFFGVSSCIHVESKNAHFFDEKYLINFNINSWKSVYPFSLNQSNSGEPRWVSRRVKRIRTRVRFPAQANLKKNFTRPGS
jgi:hypothetical protein